MVNSTLHNFIIWIAIGYRVNSKKATSFRVWATKILKDGLGNKIHKSDVSTAKNYLTEKELSELNHIVS